MRRPRRPRALELLDLSARALLLAALLPAAGGCDASRETARPSRETPARMTPAERGALRARRDIAAGRLRVYRYGNPVAFDNPRTDPESGLPLRTLLDCCVSGGTRAETEAYNRAMREEAAAKAPHPPGHVTRD